MRCVVMEEGMAESEHKDGREKINDVLQNLEKFEFAFHGTIKKIGRIKSNFLSAAFKKSRQIRIVTFNRILVTNDIRNNMEAGQSTNSEIG